MRGFYKVSKEALENIKGSNKAFFNFTSINLYPHNEHEQEKGLMYPTDIAQILS